MARVARQCLEELISREEFAIDLPHLQKCAGCRAASGEGGRYEMLEVSVKKSPNR